MSRLSLAKLGLNLWVLLGMLLLAAVLGVLNNLRVFEEQRVPWFGDVEEDPAEGNAEATP